MNTEQTKNKIGGSLKMIGLSIATFILLAIVLQTIKGVLPTIYAISYIILTWSLIAFIVFIIIKALKKPKLDNRREAATRRTNKVIDEKKPVFVFETVHSDLPRIYITEPFRSTGIFGGPGSGKSASLIEKFIIQSLQKNFTGILYDFKYPSLARVVEYARREYKSTTKFYTINLLNLNQSHRVNLLHPDIISVQSYADQFTTTILLNLKPESIEKTDYWTDEAKSYLSAIIWFLREEYPQYCTLPHVVAMVLEDTIKVVELLSTNPETRGTIASLRGAIERKADNQVSGVDSTLKTALRKINTKEIAWVFSGNEFDLNLNDPTNPKFVTLATQDDLKEVLGPPLALLISVALKQMNKPDKQESIIILDEAPTIYIPSLENLPATARSNKIATVFAAQHMGQISSAYGEKKKDILLGILSNQFWGQSSDGKTQQYVADLWGKHEVLQTSVSNSTTTDLTFLPTSRSKSVSYSYQERSRVQPNDIQELDAGEFFGQLVNSNVNSFKAQFKEQIIKTLPQVNDFRQVTNEELKANYLKIQNEVQEILKPKPPTYKTKKTDQKDEF